MGKRKSPEKLAKEAAADRVRQFLKEVDPQNQQHRDAVYRALQFLYQRQTQFEKEIGVTHDDNGVGFSGQDSEFLSSVASKSQQYKTLTVNQTRVVAKALIKYSRQLAELSLAQKPVQPPLPVVRGTGKDELEFTLSQFTASGGKLIAEASTLGFPVGMWPAKFVINGIGVPLEYKFSQKVQNGAAEYRTMKIPDAPVIVVLND